MEEFLTVAKIVKPQGIRGEVKVVALTDSAQNLKDFSKVYIGEVPYRILKVRPQDDKCAIVALSGVADRNAAEELRGREICARRADAPELPPDTYYIVDIIGCAAFNDKGEKLGVISLITPARTDIYEVEKTDGGKLVFPAVEGLILDIDVEGRKVILGAEKLAQVGLEEK